MVEAAQPLITVGLVTYNRAHLVGRAIQSVLNQSYTNFELIISDDNSTDHTTEVVSGFLSDRRVKYIKRHGIGMTQNFVETLKDARGEYFTWLCDDDYFGENYLEACLDFLDQNGDYTLACGKTNFIKGNSIQKRNEMLCLEQDDAVERITHYFRHVHSNIILYGLMRRKQILNFIYPDTFCADLLWSSQVLFSGKTKILEETDLFYSLNGISENTTVLKEYYPATKRRRINPYLVFRRELVKMVLDKETVFNQLSLSQKMKLSIKLWFIIHERFTMPKYEARLRGFLRIRSRLKALTG